MDSVSRYWNDNWNRNGIALLDAAKSAAAAARIPVAFPQLRIEWSGGASEPPTMAAARDKLLASPSPEKMWITVSDDPTMVSRRVFLRLKANGDLVHLEAEGTAMSETVAAFDAAVAVLEAEAVAQQPEPAIQSPAVPEVPRRNGTASEVHAKPETDTDQRSWLKRHQEMLELIVAVGTVVGALVGIIALFL